MEKILLAQYVTTYFSLLALSILSINEAIAQDDLIDESADGYVIITSRDTLFGVHSCHASCQTDTECPERQRCVTVPNVGQVCMSLRPEDTPPQDWALCDSIECAVTELCSRRPAPTLIQTFVEHKQRRGFEVYVIDETEWGGGEGDDAADNIRAWLQLNYQPLNIRYVLLIGDPRPTGDVPMRSTRPANNAYQSWANNPIVPTDFYYAELDGNWDLDGDGKLAEFSVQSHQVQMGSPASFHPDDLTDDLGEGGANRDAEVAVGRIPFYGHIDDLDHILQKTMDYENTPEEETLWRQSALLAAEGERRAFFGELIRTEIMEPQGYSTYRVYDVEDCWDHSTEQDEDCLSPIDGVPESLICTPNQVEIGIDDHRPGFVAWLTHGSGRGAQSVMLQSNARSLPDDQPFFTFQASCYNSQPALPDNLAYELLKNGAIGTIGAATISHGPGSPIPSLINEAGNAGMAYNYALRLIGEEMSAGEALNDLRRDVGLQNRWWYWKNYLTFNLWGDPSIGLYSHAQEEPPVEVDAGFIVDMAPVDMDLIDMAPVDMAPVDMTPVDMALVDMTPVDMTPVDMGIEFDREMIDLNIDQDDLSPPELDEALSDPDLTMRSDRSIPITDSGSTHIQDQSTGSTYVDASSELDTSLESNRRISNSSGCQSMPKKARPPSPLLILVLISLLTKRRYFRRDMCLNRYKSYT